MKTKSAARQHRRELSAARTALAKQLLPIFAAQHAHILASVASMDVIDLAFFPPLLNPETEHAKIEKAIAPTLYRIAVAGAAKVLSPAAGVPQVATGSVAAKSLAAEAANAAAVATATTTKAIDLKKFALPRIVREKIQSGIRTILSADYWKGIHAALTDRVVRVVKKSLARGDNKAATLEEIQAILSKSLKPRTRTIAETEANTLLNFGRQVAIDSTVAAAGPAIGKGWVCIVDEKTRETHLALGGVTVAANENFNVGGNLAPFPGHWSLPPEERCNCRCAVWAVPMVEMEAAA